jgi:CubicO group peptidase (beta-lactamase class C family)
VQFFSFFDQIMHRFFYRQIATTLLSLSFISCHSQTDKANAATTNEKTKPTTIPLTYEDTTTYEYRNLVRRLDSFYNIQYRHGFNGSVLIGHKGKILYERYYGIANREMGQRLTPTASVQLASISKTFTAGAILFLYQHNYLDINEKVQTYLKNFPYPDITVKMLLDHRSGIPDYIKWVPNYRKDEEIPMTNDQVLQLFTVFKPRLEFRPNTRFKYSNSNYALLASIVEKVTEMRFPEFMRKYIFGPLGMKNTFVHDPARFSLPANATISYKYNWVPEPDMYADGVYGDKNIYSTVQDMYRWDQSFYRNTLLNNETIELSYGPCSFEKPGVKNYGLGWRMFCYPNGEKIIYHNGWWHGNNTSFYRFIQENLTIVILGNKYNNGVYKHAKVLYSIVKNVPLKQGFESED